MGAGLLMVALLDGFVRFLIPGAAIVGGVLALVAWSERRPWAGIKAAGLWLLVPWGVLVLFDMVEGGGVGILFAVNKIVSMKPVALAPGVATLVVAVDLIRWTVGVGRAPVIPGDGSDSGRQA